eukprot:TRINITY_DN11274_c0_g1_i1.p1 TRINITY_DN11274_c0_g1~~TRINITY_DN11274_c0_g1_i1.p1  ORF type:complete len:283 (-),score=43.95 TRINITY_DN11274_c0_g1_i1:209-1057(-)
MKRGRSIDDISLITGSPTVRRRRRNRRQTITALPDHVHAQLVETFANADVEGHGFVNRFKMVEVVRAAYQPTEREVANVSTYLASGLALQERVGERLSLENFHNVVKLVIAKSGRSPPHWAVVQDLFHAAVAQVARHGTPDTPATVGFDEGFDFDMSLFEEEVQRYYEDCCSTGGSFVAEMVRRAFMIPARKLDQLITFFNMSKDDTVSLDQFIRGMTLLYGDMSLLVAMREAREGGVNECPSKPQSPLATSTSLHRSPSTQSLRSLSSTHDTHVTPAPLNS